MEETRTIICYTDGSCSWRNRNGGIGVYLSYDGNERTHFQGYKDTSIGRMELLAIICALKLIKNKTEFNVILYSDSEYCINYINKWREDWLQYNFVGKKNEDLLRALNDEINKFNNNTTFKHCRGHIGIEGNEIADKLARKGYKAENKILDTHNYSIERQEHFLTI